MEGKVTAPKVRAAKGKEMIVCLTAYDVFSASLCEESGVDVVLVGDSLGNVVLGYDTTLPVTLEAMVHHTTAARRGVERALLVADLPFGSYQSSVAQAVDSSVALMKAGAEAVKLEGAYADECAAIVRAGIPVMAHVGMTPQSYHRFGGFKVQGKGDAADQVLDSAIQMQEAGAFSIVLELVPAELSMRITEKLEIPTIGIGAGPHCDGQIQVFHDVLGLSGIRLKHAKMYVSGREVLGAGVKEYADEVRVRAFPKPEHSF